MSPKARNLVIVLCVVVGVGSVAFSMAFAHDRTRKNRSAENLQVEFVAEARVERLLGMVDEVLVKHRPK